ncbi:MAG: AAA family ATPase [Candidatus Aenigmatarchaeota archaeon]
MWVEKYRPKVFEEVVGNKEIVEQLKKLVRIEKDIPHILFVGKSGTGKTTLAYVIKNELQCPLLEINASDERGIDVVRGKVKLFARTGGEGLKILLLDEADMITEEAQHSLRRIMEKYPSCRFIFTANYENKIIEALRSRTKIFRLQPLTNDELLQILKRIIEKEGVKISNENLEKILKLARGDARQAINILEAGTVRGNFEEVFSEVGSLDKFMEVLKKGNIGEARKEMDLILKSQDERQFLGEIFNFILNNPNFIPTNLKSEIVLKIAEYEDRMSRSNYPYIQLFGLVIEMAKIFRRGEVGRKELGS